MTKAKKGLIITLFAAMMVFAFGATAVFADAVEPQWDTDYSGVTIGTNHYPADRTVDVNGSEWDGKVKATINLDGLSEGTIAAIAAELGLPTGTKAAVEAAVTNYYFDLNNAKVRLYAVYQQDEFDDVYNEETGSWRDNQVYMDLYIPDYVKGYVAAMASVYHPIEMNERDAASKWTFTLDTPETYKSGATSDQSFELATSRSTRGSDAGTALAILGDVPVKAITVKGTSGTLAGATFYVDSVDPDNQLTKRNDSGYHSADLVPYNGAERKVVMEEMEGFTVEYAVFNRTTGKYEPAPAGVTFKDAKEAMNGDYVFSATVTKTADKSDRTYYFRVQVTRVNAPTFGFNTDDPDDWYYGCPEFILPEGAIYDPNYFIAMTPGGAAKSAAAEAATADESQWKAYYEDRYEITSVEKKAEPGYVQLTVAQKEDLDTDALNKKYADLLANYNGGADLNEDTVAYVYFKNINTKTDHIYFTEAPNMTYKVKKAKSLKKTKSFTVAAVADSGNAVSYKISSPSKKITVDSATGKVTVKKGLKKGTYKVKVYAQTEAGNGYAAAYTYQPAQLTIKIKK